MFRSKSNENDDVDDDVFVVQLPNQDYRLHLDQLCRELRLINDVVLFVQLEFQSFEGLDEENDSKEFPLQVENWVVKDQVHTLDYRIAMDLKIRLVCLFF